MYPNVKYELHQYERLISSVSKGTGRDQAIHVKEATLRREIEAEINRIKQTFIHEVFSFGDERHLERYIQYHQQALIRLMDETVGLSTTTSPKSKFYQICFNGLEALLSFIEKHFTRYFDQDAKAPETYITITRKDLLENLAELYETLLTRTRNSRMTDVLVYAIRKIVDDDFKQNTTYRKVMYAKIILEELTTLLTSAKQDSDLEEDLMNLMYYLNYNSMKSFMYHTHYIDSVVGRMESRAEGIEKLSYFLKKINQAQVKPGIGYNTKAPSLKTQLNNYIIEEIEHVQRIQQLSGASRSQPIDSLLSSAKIQLELSVAQIAYLIKVLVEAKVIVNSNITELLKLLSRCLVSKKAETLSVDSLRTKYYNVEQSTRQTTKNVLLKVMRLMDGS